MSSIVVVESVLTTMTVPARPAARAAAHSPSGQAMRWNAVGATMTGKEMLSPRTVVEVLREDTSRSTG